MDFLGLTDDCILLIYYELDIDNLVNLASSNSRLNTLMCIYNLKSRKCPQYGVSEIFTRNTYMYDFCYHQTCWKHIIRTSPRICSKWLAFAVQYNWPDMVRTIMNRICRRFHRGLKSQSKLNGNIWDAYTQSLSSSNLLMLELLKADEILYHTDIYLFYKAVKRICDTRNSTLADFMNRKNAYKFAIESIELNGFATNNRVIWTMKTRKRIFNSSCHRDNIKYLLDFICKHLLVEIDYNMVNTTGLFLHGIQ
jgi:hypothetical protein